MRKRFIAPLIIALLGAPARAEEEPPTLMEQGAQMFLEGLMEQMAPALDDLAELLEDAGPALQSFMTEMGPKLRDVFDRVEDWSVYEAPEVMENGDIIIRRKPDAPELPPLEPAPQIEL